MDRLWLVFFLIALSCNSTQKANNVKNELWTYTSSKELEQNDLMPKEYLVLEFNNTLLEEKLDESKTPQITLPTLDRSFININLRGSGTMSSELAKKFPNIKSYLGEGVGNSSIKVRIDKNSSGLFAMIVKDGETYFVNPVEKGSLIYIVYDKRHAVRGGNPFADQVIK